MMRVFYKTDMMSILSKFLWVLVIGGAGCTTPQEPVAVQEPVIQTPTYKIKEVLVKDHKYPLPKQSSVMIEWNYPDGKSETVEAFRAWDVDHDGQFEMLVELDRAGKPIGWSFDFNGDGKIDQVKGVSSATGEGRIDGTSASGAKDLSIVDRRGVEALMKLTH